MANKKLRYEIEEHEVAFESDGFTGEVNVDDMTSIHYENIDGEVLTITTDLNKMGMLRSLAERAAKRSKLQVEIHAARFSKDIRREASVNNHHFMMDGDRIKLTENSIKEALFLDEKWQELANKRIDDETNFELTSSLYWALNEKAKKLDKLIYAMSAEANEKRQLMSRENNINN